MSSFSVRFFTPQSLPSSSVRPKTWVLAAPTSAPAASVEVDAGRLEPRVEERGGYFVLKEKFREGINPQEKVKIEKDPLKLFMEAGIEELAQMPLEEIEKAKPSKDDIDVRLKWLGLFHRRKHHYGRFMMRLKLPNGVTTSAQTRYLASVIRKYGKDGCADVTTRQNWQIRGVVLPDVPEILKGLEEVGLTSLQSGMDSVRNPVGNPLAGIDPEEIVTEEVERLVSVTRPVRMHWTGCPNSCGQVQVADIGFMGCVARDENGKPCEGADIFLGGRIGSDSHLGQVYKKAVPCKDLVPVVADILVKQFGAVPREREEGED